MPDQACPKGGIHGWRFDAHLDGEVYRYCWKCGEENDDPGEVDEE